MELLSAMNTMLRARFLRKAGDVDSTHPDAIAARDQIDETRSDVQLQRWWFNSNPCHVLAMDTDGRVPVPANTQSVDAVDKSLNYVQRNGFLYDVTNGTDVLNASVTVDIHYTLDWDDLPEMAKTYVRDKAVVEFLDTSIVTPDVVKTRKDKSAMSYALLRQKQLANEDVNSTTNPLVRDALSGYNGGHSQGYSDVWQNT